MKAIKEIYKLFKRQYDLQQAARASCILLLGVIISTLVFIFMIDGKFYVEFVFIAAFFLVLAIISHLAYKKTYEKANLFLTKYLKETLDAYTSRKNKNIRVIDVVFREELKNEYDIIFSDDTVDFSKDVDLKVKLVSVKQTLQKALLKEVVFMCNGIVIC